MRRFLDKKGFINIKQNGNTNAPDGGVDIYAEEEFRTVLGMEKRIWLWQCKHIKSPISRSSIFEIQDLLDEKGANCYGIITSNCFTPEAISRLNFYKNDKKLGISYFGRAELDIE